MRYASVCSGVEAASLAWMPLGWEAAWFSEIEPFPCAVLAERFPNVPNLGDMTKISIQTNGDITYGADAVIANDGRTIDLIVGGTPCQDASVAGKRAGLVEGERSKLAFTFTRLAYELAAYRGLRWIVWENVPGVFSLNRGRDFAAFLSSLAGRDVAVPDGGWKSFGIVRPATDGNFGLCWRVLDVQYARVDGFPRAIPQRRRRVFLVGYIGDWRRAAEVLFEPKSLLGDTPPGRTKRQEAAADAGRCVEKADGFRKSSYGAFVDGNESGTLKAVGGVLGGGSETLVKQQLVSEGKSLTLGTGNDQVLCVADMMGGKAGAHVTGGEVCPTITSGRGSSSDVHAVCFQQNARDEVREMNGDGQIAGALSAESGMKQQNYLATFDNHANDSRVTPCDAPNIPARAGTGGGNGGGIGRR